MEMQKKEIESIISDINPIVSATSNSLKEIEQNIMVKTSPGCVSFMGVNEEFEISVENNTCSFGLSKIASDEFLISGKKFISVLKSIKENENISIQHSNYKVFARSDKNRFTLKTSPTADFSFIERSAPRELFSIDSTLLLRMINGSLCAINKNTLLPMFSGILFKISRKILTVIGTDGHILSYKFGAINEEHSLEEEFIIPCSAGTHISLITKELQENIVISIHRKYAQFVIGRYKVRTILMDGTYPDCRDLISKITGTKSVVMDANRLNLSLNSVFALQNKSEKEGCIRCEIRKNLVRLFIINSEKELAESTFKAEYDGDNVDFGFNPKYIINIIKTLGKLKSETKLEIKYDKEGCRLFVEDIYKNKKDGSFYVVGSLEK